MVWIAIVRVADHGTTGNAADVDRLVRPRIEDEAWLTGNRHCGAILALRLDHGLFLRSRWRDLLRGGL